MLSFAKAPRRVPRKVLRPLLLAGLLVIAGLAILDGVRTASGASKVATAAGPPPLSTGTERLPQGRHMEPVSDAVTEQATLPPGIELLVGPGIVTCHSDNVCTLRDQDDPDTALVFGIGALDNDQRHSLIDNPALVTNPVAVRLIRRNDPGAAYEALQVMDSRTRETIGPQ
nr:hypothetical protein [uncultured Lichenicoccus sp.]